MSRPVLLSPRRLAAAALAGVLALSLLPSVRHVRHPAYGIEAAPAEVPEEAAEP